MLEVQELSVRYGKHTALDGVSLSAERGEMVVILGANGAGKSSLLNAVAGRVPPSGGTVRFAGKDTAKIAAHELVERGIALVPEGRGIFRQMSVEENLMLGAAPRRARNEAAKRRQVLELFPNLGERRRQIAGTMSGGEQQMVAIARALMSEPELLLLDEPSLGLAPIVTQEVFAALSEIRGTGLTVVMVEQNVRASLTLADRGYLLEAGRIVGAGTAGDLARSDAVRHAFLGGAALREAP